MIEKVGELQIQGVLMNWLMLEKHHEWVLPNSTQFFPWEADLLSMTKSGLVHEFEIKISIADYKRDAEKRKHHWLGVGRSPAYFWYVTYDFEIDPPTNAGWLLITQTETRNRFGWAVDMKKEAPVICKWKPTPKDLSKISRLLSWRVYNMYLKQHLRKV